MRVSRHTEEDERWIVVFGALWFETCDGNRVSLK